MADMAAMMEYEGSKADKRKDRRTGEDSRSDRKEDSAATRRRKARRTLAGQARTK